MSRPAGALTIFTDSIEETRRLGTNLGTRLQAGDVIGLRGDLGSGKTTFTQGLAAGMAVAPERQVASPTFALVNEYPGRVPLIHADLYRVKDESELHELGLDEAFDVGVSVVEWFDRFAGVLPDERLEISISICGEHKRRFELTGHGPRSAAWLSGLGPEIP